MTNQCEVWWPFSLEKTENWSQILPDFKIWLLFSGQMFGIMIKKFGFHDFIFLQLDAKPFSRKVKYSHIKKKSTVYMYKLVTLVIWQYKVTDNLKYNLWFVEFIVKRATLPVWCTNKWLSFAHGLSYLSRYTKISCKKMVVRIH